MARTNAIDSGFFNNADGFSLAGGVVLRTFTFQGGDFTFDSVTFTNNQTKLDYLTVTQAVDLDNIEGDVADLVTLSGVAANSTDLGTFTGTIINDNRTIKQALQDLEDQVEIININKLEDLTDVSTAATTNGFILIANGSSYAGRAFVEADISMTDITTNNTSTLQHGFAPKLSGTASQYLDGAGNWTTPSGTTTSYTSVGFGPTTSANVIHNFNVYPAVQVIVGGEVFTPLSIVHNTVNDFTVTFSQNQSGTIVATVGSPQPNNYITAAGNYSVDSLDYIVKATGVASTITLPTAVGIDGKKFLIKNGSTGNITVDTTSSQTMDGDLTIVLTPNEALEVVSDGANYLII